MTCEQASLLMTCLVVDDPGVTDEQRAAFARHLMLCAACAAEYEDCQEISRLVREHGGPIDHETQQLLEQAGYPVPQNTSGLKPLMSVEEGWQDLLKRCPGLAEAHRREQRQEIVRQMFGRIRQAVAIAASLALVLVGGWLLNSYLKSAPPTAPHGYAELVTADGPKALALGEPVQTQDQRREILLGGMHRVVMNQNTSATFSADQGSYQIRLVQGGMYVEVMPGHRFTVMTANARLEITGTKFDVRAQSDKTELTLLKGSVRFTSLSQGQGQAVDVKAGYASAVIGRSAPTSPAAVDAMATTAWARDAVLSNAVARAGSQFDAELLDFSRDWWRQPPPADPATLDYAAWRDAHRNDCARQYAWAIKAEQLLQRQGIHADWIDVLIVSGDVWQFHSDPKLSTNHPLTKIEPGAVARLARRYGVDEREMFRAVGLPDSTPIPTLPIQNPTHGEQRADTLRRWHDALLASTQGNLEAHGDLVLFSLRASRHLVTTRTAAYLWAKGHPQEAKQLLADAAYRTMLPLPLTTDGEDAWLKQLRQQAVAARSSAQVAMEWFLVPAGNGCVSQATEQQRKLAALVAELL